MSTPTPDPIPAPVPIHIVPPPPPPTDWTKVIAVIVAAILAGMKGQQLVGPTPEPTPAPVPDGGKVTPPTPLPNPSPLGSVQVTDIRGANVTSPKPGQLITVSSSSGAQITVSVDPNSDGEFKRDSSSKYTGVLNSGTLTAIIADGKSDSVIQSVKCLTAPQPPPNPNPGPNPNPQPSPLPQPDPAPKAKNVSVAIVEDQSAKSLKVAKIMGNFAEWSALSQAGVTWCRYDKGTTETVGSKATRALAAANVQVTGDNSGYVIFDRDTWQVLAQGPMVDLADIKTHLQSLTGKVL